jgi:hypothetical protein
MKKLIKTTVISLLALMILGQNISVSAHQLAGPDLSATFLSEIKDAPITFTSLGARWHEIEPAGTNADIYVKFNTDTGWTDWKELRVDIDGKVEADPAYPNAFLAVNSSTQMQYKVELSSAVKGLSPVIENLEFTYINAHEKVSENTETGIQKAYAATDTPLEARFAAYAGGSNLVSVIPRSTWGANENLRVLTADRPEQELVDLPDDYYVKYASEMKIARTVAFNEKGQELTWPLAYPEKTRKIIIHHTATVKNLDNPAQAIRDIYYWHTISKGWGDIGYNFIIDTKGNIYEGRFGGDNVVAAHAGGANTGSIGIAVLGNYETSRVPDAVKNSLTALIKHEAAKYNIDTTGKSMFRGEYIDNVIGHRDVMATTCPGKYLYELLPEIRKAAYSASSGNIIDRRRNVSDNTYNFELGEVPQYLKMDPGESRTIKIQLKNTGTSGWSDQTFIAVAKTDSSEKYLAGTFAKSKNIGRNVLSGQTATFELPLTSTIVSGYGELEIFLMVNGSLKVEKYLIMPLSVINATYDYQVESIGLDKSVLNPGETATATVKVRNLGTVTWRRIGENVTLLGTENPRDRSALITSKHGTRLAKVEEMEVHPGGVGTFNINIVAPSQEGVIREYFAPVIEGVTWMPFKQNYIELKVFSKAYNAALKEIRNNGIFAVGETRAIVLEFENRGTETWENATFDVSSSNGLTIGNVRAQNSSVSPGNAISVLVTITAPAVEGMKFFSIMPKVNNVNLMVRPQLVFVEVKEKVQRYVEPSTVASNVTTAAAATVPSAPGNLRVALSFEGDPVISGNGKFILFDNGTGVKVYSADEKAKVTYLNGAYYVDGRALIGVPRFQPVTGTILRIDNFENRPAWKPELNDNEYRGILEVNRYDNKLRVINELPLEDYMKGVAEISASDPYEKIKTITILARSYARFYMTEAEKFPGAPFHIDDSPDVSQKYLGYGFEKRNPTGVKAVNDTAGLVVTYNGKVIKTPYFHSDDGRTRSAQEVWGWTNTPYLVSVEDPGCKGQTLQGHGVGLSGCGSAYMAGLGKTYTEIIKYFYKGVEIAKIK